ncbi:effector binding domain-containing protein [Lederbergia lenta]|uniref:DNA-binding protein YobU n=1 Tax=Lederbergia lenta TaxID=1467 RepID=A0A2X4WAH7_LEDLE|nr:zinc ribbon domain-containing protein [Lederbergia lenta]MCM3110571.1 effector binding domain-containing protein [Lederbergia lenta]SQI61176.1 DNA-binding protein YobU [Lederbergia lenta]
MQTYCQSCSMPMTEDKLYGTEKGGEKSKDYCMHCYKEGSFLDTDITMKEMIDFCVAILVKEGWEEEKSRVMLKNSMPFLKRWRQAKPRIEPFYITREGFQFVGIAERTTNMAEITNKGKIPLMWERFYKDGISEQILNLGASSETLALYSDYTSDVSGEYTFSIGKIVTSSVNVPENMMMFNVPTAKYAVFTTEIGPVTEIVPKAWSQIWNWFEKGEVKRTYSGDFECYDAKSANPHEAQVDIYIAIK